MKDKIVINEGWFVQIVVSLIMTFSFFKDMLHTVWSLPFLVGVVVFVNLYCNALAIGWKLHSKTLKLKWCFVSSFDYLDRPRFFKRLAEDG